MKSESIKNLAISVLEDLKGIDIAIIDVKSLTSLTDYMIICTGRSTTHLQAIAENLVMKAKSQHLSFIHREGDRDSDWVLIDLGDVVVHVMLANTRSFYSIEELWEPVKEMREGNV